MRGWAMLAAAAVLLMAPPVSAHERPRSSSRWTIDGTDVSVTAELSRADVSIVEAAGFDMDHYLPEHLALRVHGRRCPPSVGSFAELPGTASVRRYGFALSCQSRDDSVTIEADPMMDLVPGHVHLAAVHAFGGDSFLAFGEDHRFEALGARAKASFFRLGAAHVAGGWDHLVFVLLLVALAGTPRRAFGWVTGFSLGHAASLVAVALGWVAIDSAMVELAIALSIALVGVELAWSGASGARSRLWATSILAIAVISVAGAAASAVVVGVSMIAVSLGALASSRPAARLGFSLLFGLVHGLGFAGGLVPLLPEGQLARPLLTFNIGVELAQLVAALGLFVLVHVLRRVVGASTETTIAAAGLGASSYWLVIRALSIAS